MKVIEISEEDAIQLGHVFQLLHTGNKLRKGLAGAGVQFQGTVFDEEKKTMAWLQSLSEQAIASLHPKTYAKPKAKVKPKAKAKPAITKKKKRKIA